MEVDRETIYRFHNLSPSVQRRLVSELGVLAKVEWRLKTPERYAIAFDRIARFCDALEFREMVNEAQAEAERLAESTEQ